MNKPETVTEAKVATLFRAAEAHLEHQRATAGVIQMSGTNPPRFVAIGTPAEIAQLLREDDEPASAASHPARRLRRGDRPTEPLSWDESAPAATSGDAPADLSGAHHLAPDNIAAVIRDLRAIEDGTTEFPVEHRDWRTEAGVLARIIEHLVDCIERAAAPAPTADKRITCPACKGAHSGMGADGVERDCSKCEDGMIAQAFLAAELPAAEPVYRVSDIATKPAAAPAVPEGWMLVPKVPTPKMVDATFNERVENESHNARNKRIYAAMLAAAPCAMLAAAPAAPTAAPAEQVRDLTSDEINDACALIYRSDYYSQGTQAYDQAIADAVLRAAGIRKSAPDGAQGEGNGV